MFLDLFVFASLAPLLLLTAHSGQFRRLAFRFLIDDKGPLQHNSYLGSGIWTMESDEGTSLVEANFRDCHSYKKHIKNIVGVVKTWTTTFESLASSRCKS